MNTQRPFWNMMVRFSIPANIIDNQGESAAPALSPTDLFRTAYPEDGVKALFQFLPYPPLP